MAKQDRRSRDGSIRNTAIRGQRLEGLVCDELNSILDGELTDPVFEGAHITRVELARDGSSARVWFVTNESQNRSTPTRLQAAFERASGLLRSRLCEALPLKRIPELRFRHDPSAPIETRPEDLT